MSDRSNKWNRERLDFLRSLFPTCPICGEPNDENSEWAHVHPTELNGRGRGRNARLYDIQRNLDCYRLMHHDCHVYYDAVLNDDDSTL